MSSYLQYEIKGRAFCVTYTASGNCVLTLRAPGVNATGRKAFEKMRNELDEMESQLAKLNNWEGVWSYDDRTPVVAGGDKDAEQAVGEAEP